MYMQLMDGVRVRVRNKIYHWVPMVDLVSTSSELLVESIKYDRLDIKSPPSKAKAKCK